MTGPDVTSPAAGDDFGDFLAGVTGAVGSLGGLAATDTPEAPPPRPATPPPAPRGPVSRTHPLRTRLDDLLTRCFYSGAGYVFESDPHVVPEDDELLKALASVREEDRRHAFVLGALVQSLGGVPSPGVFPWWNLDLNFQTVPCISRFVVETLEDEVGLYEAIVRDWFPGDAGGRAALASILEDKRRHVATLKPVVEAAVAREAADYKAKIAKLKQVRTARQAKEKAAADAAKKAKAAAGRPAAPGAPKPAAAAAPAAALLDPKEPGISSHERGRRTVLKMRAELGIKAPGVVGAAPAGGAPAAAPVAAPAGAELLDPNEPGISPKEKAKRAVAKQRAAAGGGAAVSAAPAAAPAAPAVELLDPNEPGISPKEKARRAVAKNRAAAGGGAPVSAAPAGAPAAGAAPAPAAAPAAPPPPPAEELLDPDEPGISSKEKGRRKVLWMRAHKQG